MVDAVVVMMGDETAAADDDDDDDDDEDSFFVSTDGSATRRTSRCFSTADANNNSFSQTALGIRHGTIGVSDANLAKNRRSDAGVVLLLLLLLLLVLFLRLVRAVVKTRGE